MLNLNPKFVENRVNSIKKQIAILENSLDDGSYDSPRNIVMSSWCADQISLLARNRLVSREETDDMANRMSYYFETSAFLMKSNRG